MVRGGSVLLASTCAVCWLAPVRAGPRNPMVPDASGKLWKAWGSDLWYFDTDQRMWGRLIADHNHLAPQQTCYTLVDLGSAPHLPAAFRDLRRDLELAPSTKFFVMYGGLLEDMYPRGELWLLIADLDGFRISASFIPSSVAAAVGSPVPRPRFGHVAVSAGNGSFWVLGGKGVKMDLWRCDVTLETWTPWTLLWESGNASEGPGPDRFEHAAAFGHGCLWFHGGLSEGSSSTTTAESSLPERVHNDLWCYNVSEHAWAQMASGPAFYGHTAGVMGEGLWLYGLADGADVGTGLLWHFEPRHQEWTLVRTTASGAPVFSRGSCISDDASALLQGRLWLFDEHVEPRDLDPRMSVYAVGGRHADALLKVIQNASSNLWSFDLGLQVWRHESQSHDDRVTNRFQVVIGLVSGLLVFLLVLALTTLRLEFGTFKVKETRCKWICRPVTWDRDRRARFVFQVSLSLLCCSLVVFPVLLLARWMARSYVNEPLNLNMFHAPLSYVVLAVVLLFFFQFWESLRAWRSEDAPGSLMDPKALASFLLDADIKLVRLEFLRDLHARGEVLPRRQEAEGMKSPSGRSALVSHMEMADWAQAMARRPQEQRVISVSHCWETMQHPDPYGNQLREVVELLDPAWRMDTSPVVGVFIDFVSLFQYKRGCKHEEVSFRCAMRNMHIMYAHEWTHTLCVTKLSPGELKSRLCCNDISVYRGEPGGCGGVQLVRAAGLEENLTPYEKRGWCLAELQWSSLRISSRFGHLLQTSSLDSQRILRRAPQAPAVFRNMLSKSSVVFTHRSDFLPLVSAQKEAFEMKSRQVKALELEELPKEELDHLADALQSYASLEELQLSNCPTIAVPGFLLRLTWIPSLRKIALKECGITDDDVDCVAEALTSSCPWASLDLSSNMIGDAGALVLGTALKAAVGRESLLELEQLCLHRNRIGDVGAESLVEASAELLRLGGQGDVPAAAGISRARRLCLDLSGNPMTAEVRSTLRAAKPEGLTLLVEPLPPLRTGATAPEQFAYVSAETPPQSLAWPCCRHRRTKAPMPSL